MEETLITYETAVLAKSKGFKYFDEYHSCSQSLLQKWLREVHNIHVYCIFFMPTKVYRVSVDFTRTEGKVWHGYEYDSDTYEAALEIGLQEGLKLIV